MLNYVASQLNITVEEKQKLLEINDFSKRMNKVLSYLDKEIHEQEVKIQIQQKVSTDIDKQQREYFLNQQLKTIQEELGGNPAEQTIQELKEKAKKKHWNDSVKEIFEKEIKKLSNIHTSSPDYSIELNYINFILDLPWNNVSEDNYNIDKARKVLDEDHYGLRKSRKE